jgi:hypothetical protein
MKNKKCKQLWKELKKSGGEPGDGDDTPVVTSGNDTSDGSALNGDNKTPPVVTSGNETSGNETSDGSALNGDNKTPPGATKSGISDGTHDDVDNQKYVTYDNVKINDDADVPGHGGKRRRKTKKNTKKGGKKINKKTMKKKSRKCRK